jgi:FkbM family methyltransferase
MKEKATVLQDKEAISAEKWPEGLYPISVRGQDKDGQWLHGAIVKLTPCPPNAVFYETRLPVPAEGSVVKNYSVRFDVLVPPGEYEVAFTHKRESPVIKVTVSDPVAQTVQSPGVDKLPVHYRDSRWDKYIMKENSYGALDMNENDTVIDIGAHIGIFSRKVLAKGARVLAAYEPESDNCRLLNLNLSEYDKSLWNVQQAAVVADDFPFVEERYAKLWIDAAGDGDSSRTALHSLYRIRGARVPVLVPAVTWSSVLALNPTVLKVDVEGAELTYDWSLLSNNTSIRSLALELENTKSKTSTKGNVIDDIKKAGFILTNESSGWSTVQIWSRK